MPHPHWPLFDVRVVTPRLTLQYVDDALATQLATLAAAGVHDPAYMPFLHPWTDVPSPDLERDALRYYWRTRAGTTPTSWSLVLAVLVDGRPVGSVSLDADDFPLRRWFMTGSWLGRAFHGAGLGTELRIAALHLGFVGLDAAVATTEAFHDNGPSLGVTRALGYEPNGVASTVRRGRREELRRFVMTRERFDDRVRRDDIDIPDAGAIRSFLGVSRSAD